MLELLCYSAILGEELCPCGLLLFILLHFLLLLLLLQWIPASSHVDVQILWFNTQISKRLSPQDPVLPL
jgi:hypothetical protein